MNSSRPKNQRLSKPHHRKQHLLDVTVRRDIARSQRNRAVFAFFCKLILLLGSCVGLYLGGKEGLRRYLWENPEYYLSDVRVTTDGTLTREQVLTAGGLIEGRNIFTINLAQARAALNELPQVERVEVERTLPNKISVNITERRPIAWVAQRAGDDPVTSEKSFLIDARGVVMRSKAIKPEYVHLPVISGVEVENLAPGQKVRSYEMQAALDLIRYNGDNARFQAQNLDLSKGYCLVVTDQLRRKITFGLDRVDLQLQRFLQYLDYLEPTGKDLRTVNLLIERNTPVTFAEPPVAESEPVVAPPAPSKSESSREKPASSREKAPVSTKKPSPSSTSTPSPSSSRTKDQAPSGEKRIPVESLKKPFRSHG